MKLQPLLASISCVSWLGVFLNACVPIQFSEQMFIQEKSGSERGGRAKSEGVAAIAAAPDKQIANQVYQKVNPAVVTIYGVKEIGSGMIVSSEGLILTNKHVVQNSTQVGIKTVTGEVYAGRVVDFDLRHDLALVRLNAQGIHLPTVSLTTKPDVKVGDSVYAIGSPGGISGMLTQGTFLGITEHGSLQLSSGLLSPGNSGGPLLNMQGDVIGISKGLLKDNSGLATSVSAAKELVGRYERVNKQRS